MILQWLEHTKHLKFILTKSFKAKDFGNELNRKMGH